MAEPRGSAWPFVAAWIIGTALIAAADAALGEVFLFLALLAPILWILTGIGFAVILLFRRRWRPLLALLLSGAIIAVSPLPGWGAHAWFWFRFKQDEDIYRQIVSEAANLPPRGTVEGVPYLIELGPPRRVAFPQRAGIADNWGAVIHDPSDAMASARGWGSSRGDFTAPAELRGLWGGDLLSCSRISGHYYRCWFT